MRVSFYAVSFLGMVPTAAVAESEVGRHCSGATWPTCYSYIEGPIESGSFEKIEAFFLSNEGQDANGGSIYLHSRGGSLAEALKIGRFVREQGYDTKVGRVVDHDAPSFAQEGVCESACAYIFMGGERRTLRTDDVLGVHRFYSTGRSIEGGTAQQMSGLLITYMVEMGVDARLFALASNQAAEGMHHVTMAEAQDYDLVTDSRYGELNLEPYKDGIVAWTRPADLAAPGNVDQVTFLCRGGKPEVLFFLKNQAGVYESKSVANGGDFQTNLDGELANLDASFVSGRDLGKDAYYTVRINLDLAQALSSASEANLAIWYPSVVGGGFEATLSFSEIDHSKLEYTFSNCIE